MNSVSKGSTLNRRRWAPSSEVKERLGQIGIPLKAALVWIGEGALRLHAHTLVVRGNVLLDHEVPRKAALRGTIDWDHGELSYYGGANSEFPGMVHAAGLAFRREQLDQLFPSLSDRLPPSRAGSPGKVAEWHKFWLTAMQLLYEGRLEAFESQTALRDELLSQCGLSEESVKPHVGRIWHSFRRREF